MPLDLRELTREPPVTIGLLAPDRGLAHDHLGERAERQ
jgi:hypothetical protein